MDSVTAPPCHTHSPVCYGRSAAWTAHSSRLKKTKVNFMSDFKAYLRTENKQYILLPRLLLCVLTYVLNDLDIIV